MNPIQEVTHVDDRDRKYISGIPTFKQFCIENAENFKLKLENSAVEKNTRDEILLFMNALPTNDFHWDMNKSFAEALERWGDDFVTLCAELEISTSKG